MEKENCRNGVVNHFEAGSNCQVFNGDITRCVFAMPGASVIQQTGNSEISLDEKEQDIVTQLKPIFYGSEEEVKAFFVSIQGMKPSQITERVRQLVKEKKISDLSCRRDLWKVLHDSGIYPCSESNWNQQVK
ncbi:MAG: hypothetical protein IJV27_04710 [Prevotella sp.]|nr:hypothetical protein [Prevotella sp.]